jgi:uncharacterized protein DUF4126
MDVVPWVFTSGWASGINGYVVVLLLGGLGRFTGVESVPPGLERTDVLVAAAILFCLDAVADKIAYVDSVWDAVHTAIRPVIGAVVSALIAGHDGSLPQLAAGAAGGGLALISHLVKAGVRAGVNTSPEPFSNIVVSTAEDVTVAGVICLGLLNPWLAAAVAALLLITGLTLVVLLFRRIRAFYRRRRQRRALRSPGTGLT